MKAYAQYLSVKLLILSTFERFHLLNDSRQMQEHLACFLKPLNMSFELSIKVVGASYNVAKVRFHDTL